MASRRAPARTALGAWLVDPAERTLEAFRLDGGLWTRIASHDDKARARIAPFEAVELELALLFPPAR